VIAILVSERKVSWVSAQEISDNLKKAYSLIAPEQNIQFFNYSSRMSPKALRSLAKRISRASPKQLIFLDFEPHPGQLLMALDRHFGPSGLPLLVFHAYGSTFCSDFHLWKRLEPIFKKTGLRIIAASPRHRHWMNQFLKNKNSAVDYCPFPIDEERFYYSKAARDRFRKANNWETRDSIILYTGRLSTQKNVLALTREVAFYLENNPLARFVLAGTFDDLSALFLASARKGGA
jgi:glycosyltransferase involved in cell wall biosynthesis